MPTLDDLANAIVRMEGYGTAGAPTITNANNPGALRNSPYQNGTVTGPNGTFATFATYQDGYDALLYDLQQKQSRGLTLRDAIYTYAPPTENNTTNYLTNIVNWTGLSADAPLTDLGANVGAVSTDGTFTLGDSGSSFDSGSLSNVDTQTLIIAGVVAVAAIAVLMGR